MDDKFRANAAAKTPLWPKESATTTERTTPNQADTIERRTETRYPVSAAAELIETASHTRLSARAADLSLSGCYLDAINLFPVGSTVRVRLTTEAHSFECEARVAYSLQGMGMGIVFTNMSPAQATALRDWIAELSGATVSAAPQAPAFDFNSTKRRSTERESYGRWQDVMSDLLSVLQRKGILTESEADGIRNKITR